MKNSIKAKLILLVTGIIITIISIQIISNLFLAKPYFIIKKTNQMEEMFSDLKNNFESHEEIEKAMMHYVEDENIHVIVKDKNFEIIFNSTSNIFDYDLKKIKFSLDPEIKIKINPRTEKESLTLFGEINAPMGIFYVVFDTPVSAVERSVAVINELNIYIAIFSLLIGSICAYYWGRLFTKPIIEIDLVAQSVANLDFSKRVQIPFKSDEIGRLGTSINSMADQLSDLISNLKEANIQLEKDVNIEKKINNMRKEFIANVSHELKSPLALLVMYAENLKLDLKGIDKNFYYDVIIDESTRLGELVKKLLDISSLENGFTKMKNEQLNISNLISWLCSKKQITATKKSINIALDIEENLEVKGDMFYLEQAFTNLIDNALTYTGVGRTINIKIALENEEVKCSIKNEGVIIPEEELEKIWESFYKLDKAHTPQGETHAGLGLYIVSIIINAHNGKFGANSLGNGMEFWFTIPNK